MEAATLLLLGPPELRGAAGAIALPSSKARALLWYLGAQPGRMFQRAELAGLLWEGAAPEDQRNSLNTTLSRLRQALLPWPLHSERDSIGWHPAAEGWLDTARFLALTRSGAPGPHDRAGERQRLTDAVSLWRGPLLAGFGLPGHELYQEWLEQERGRWEQRLVQALSRLLVIDEANRDWTALAAHARQAVELDPLRERCQRSLITAYAMLGDRGAALAQYRTCAQVLASELGVAPDPTTTALRDAIAAGNLAAPAPAGAGGRPTIVRSNPPGPPLVGREQELRRLEQALAERGQRPLVVLAGEAGIGKTRLVQELRRRWTGGRCCWAPALQTCATCPICPSRPPCAREWRPAIPTTCPFPATQPRRWPRWCQSCGSASRTCPTPP